MADINNLLVDINEDDKLVLHRFSILNEDYVLVAVCPQEVDALGEIGLTAARIVNALS
jgi:hypothetical protein